MSDSVIRTIFNAPPSTASEAGSVYETKPADDVDVERHNISDIEQRVKTLTWKRLALSFLLGILSFCFTFFVLSMTSVQSSDVLYSSRYSKDYRFRPAASPVVTETLADGRTRIRGALPTAKSK